MDALRRFRADAEIPPGKVLEAVFVSDDSDVKEHYEHYAGVFRAMARTALAFTGEPAEDATVVLVPGGRLEVAAAVDKA